MEEIDIIELLKRVKEGKAPKKIEINNEIYSFVNKHDKFVYFYINDKGESWNLGKITLNTKIKILDKPIIEELSENDMFVDVKVGNKINEIIKWINKENKDE